MKHIYSKHVTALYYRQCPAIIHLYSYNETVIRIVSNSTISYNRPCPEILNDFDSNLLDVSFTSFLKLGTCGEGILYVWKSHLVIIALDNFILITESIAGKNISHNG